MKKKKNKHKPCTYMFVDPAHPRKRDTIRFQKQIERDIKELNLIMR